MPTESGLKLRTKLESARTLAFTNSSTTQTLAAGDMTLVNDTIGAVVEPVATQGSSPSDQFPHGDEGVLVYAAERVLLPKASADTFSPGDRIYFDATANNVTATATGNTVCGRAVRAASATDTEVEADLIVLT